MADFVEDHPRREHLIADTEIPHTVLDHPQAVVCIVNGKTAGITQPINVAPQDTHADGMKCPGVNLITHFTEHGVQALFQLPCRFVCKGNGENIPRSWRTHRQNPMHRFQILPIWMIPVLFQECYFALSNVFQHRFCFCSLVRAFAGCTAFSLPGVLVKEMPNLVQVHFYQQLVAVSLCRKLFFDRMKSVQYAVFPFSLRGYMRRKNNSAV